MLRFQTFFIFEETSGIFKSLGHILVEIEYILMQTLNNIDTILIGQALSNKGTCLL